MWRDYDYDESVRIANMRISLSLNWVVVPCSPLQSALLQRLRNPKVNDIIISLSLITFKQDQKK